MTLTYAFVVIVIAEDIFVSFIEFRSQVSVSLVLINTFLLKNSFFLLLLPRPMNILNLMGLIWIWKVCILKNSWENLHKSQRRAKDLKIGSDLLQECADWLLTHQLFQVINAKISMLNPLLTWLKMGYLSMELLPMANFLLNQKIQRCDKVHLRFLII